jgi:hypothetical protein
MKRIFVILAALSLAAAGCTKNKTSSDVTPGTNTVSGPEWKLQLKASCTDGTAEDNCIGAHGFAVTAEGKYEVGPTAAGRTFTGYLSPSEFKQIQDVISGVLDNSNAQDQEGTLQTSSPDTTVTLVRAGRERVLLSNTADALKHQLASEADARALHSAIYQHAFKYYPQPLPGDCGDAVAALQDLYGTVQSCSQDSDCSYITGDFVAVASTTETVVTDRGEQAMPLIVANSSAVESNRAALQGAWDKAVSSCTSRGGLITEFTASAPAVCQKSVCRVNPAIQY